MKEIQGKSTLVRVSARFELSGVDCTVKLYNLPNYFCRGLWFVTEVMAAMLVDKNKLFPCKFCKKYIYVLPRYHVVANRPGLFPILGKF